MSVIGRFERDGDGFVGALSTLHLRVRLRIAPTHPETSPGPHYLVLDEELVCGVAWRARGPAVLLNVKLDDPSWTGPVYARLLAGEREDLPLVWTRPRRHGAGASPQSDDSPRVRGS